MPAPSRLGRVDECIVRVPVSHWLTFALIMFAGSDIRRLTSRSNRAFRTFGLKHVWMLALLVG
jgi:hypothetical protein